MRKPKIILWDIETSGIVATTWNLYPTVISHHNMLQDWFIICAAWKELGKKTVKTVSVMDDPKRFTKDSTDDYYVIKQLREMLSDVDILIHHNGDKFDIKMFNSRLIYHGLPPLPLLATVDTLKEVKKVSKFTSHRLDFLGTKFFGSGKEDTPPGTWLKAMKGEKKAIRDMVKYNKVDVELLEKLYLKLRPYMKAHPHTGAMLGVDRNGSCPKCGSTSFKRNGLRFTATGLHKQECQCKECLSYFRLPLVKV